MAHDATVLLLGTTLSNDRTVTCEPGDPATFVAGTAVRRASTGELLIEDDAVAALIGVSLGPDLTDTTKTAVCRTGNWVPILLTNSGDASTYVNVGLTFTSKLPGTLGDDISIEFLDTGTAGSEVVTVTDKKISVSMDGGVSTNTQLKTAIDAKTEAAALITVTIAGGQGAVAHAAFAEAFLSSGTDDYDYAVIGQPVEISDTTGLAIESGDTTAAKYLSGSKDALDPSTGLVIGKAAFIDMGGGL